MVYVLNKIKQSFLNKLKGTKYIAEHIFLNSEQLEKRNKKQISMSK
jgi:hypothetical protein